MNVDEWMLNGWIDGLNVGWMVNWMLDICWMDVEWMLNWMLNGCWMLDRC